ncbi:26s proteasome subunit, partial [Cystoisospora suis]
MGNAQQRGPGGGGGFHPGGGEDDKDKKKKDRKRLEAASLSHTGKKKKRGAKGPGGVHSKFPTVTPVTKCRLRLLKLERIKDYLLLEEEYITNQEQRKPAEEKNEEDVTRVDELRGTPLSVGNLEEMIDDQHAIVSSSIGPEYYVNVLSFVDKDLLEPGCSVLLHNKVNQHIIHPPRN